MRAQRHIKELGYSFGGEGREVFDWCVPLWYLMWACGVGIVEVACAASKQDAADYGLVSIF